MASRKNHGVSVFINCPFDEQYKPFFQALNFSVYAASLKLRCALEVADSSQVRLAKTLTIIDECRFGIHDISRTESNVDSKLPRFNVPLELGIFLGCKTFGAIRHQRKSCLILDSERFRFQEFISDLSGQDIESHDNNPETAIRCVRNWLRSEMNLASLPSAEFFIDHYRAFQRDLPSIAKELSYNPDQLTFADLAFVITEWLKTKKAKSR